MNLVQPAARLPLVAWLVAAPAIGGALWLAAIGGGRFLQQESRSDSIGLTGSFADAIRHRSVEDAYAFVRAGQNPNELVAFRDPHLTGDREVMISPLLLAVAAKNDGAVMMLMSFGARMDVPDNSRAVCLAHRLGYDDIAGIITRDGGPVPAVTCPELPPAPAPPLPAFVETSR